MSDFPLSCTPLSLYGQGAGLCLLLQIGSYRFLLDCGLAPLQLPQCLRTALSPNGVELPLHGVILSHAHQCQTEGLYAFAQLYPTVPLYSSSVTAQLINFSVPAADRALRSLQPLSWRSVLQIRSDLTLELFPAGHLPGAAMALFTYTPENAAEIITETTPENTAEITPEITSETPANTAENTSKNTDKNTGKTTGKTATGKPIRPYTVLYTGDCTLTHGRFVEGLPLAELRGLRPDVLIVDGAAGTVRYGRRRQQELALLNGLDRAFQAGRSVVLPVAPWGLGQELLLSFKGHLPLAAQQRHIYITEDFAPYFEEYQTLLSQFPSAVQNLARQQSLFWEDDRFPRVQRLRAPDDTDDTDDNDGDIENRGDSQRIEPQPALILARDDRDWTQYLPALRGWEVWFLRNTEGEVAPLKPWMEKNLQQWMPADAIVPWSVLQARLRSGQGQIQTYFFPEHCDGTATTQLIHNLRPQHVLLVGPHSDRLAELAALEELSSRYKIHLPALGQTTEFLVGETFFQPTTPDLYYETELQEDSSGAWLPFPATLTQDPRWQRLADTGILQLRWQGDELVLRGLSGRELINQDLCQRDRLATPALNVQNCGTCRHYRSQRCWNLASPLNGFKVSPEGFCPQHEG